MNVYAEPSQHWGIYTPYLCGYTLNKAIPRVCCEMIAGLSCPADEADEKNGSGQTGLILYGCTNAGIGKWIYDYGQPALETPKWNYMPGKAGMDSNA